MERAFFMRTERTVFSLWQAEDLPLAYTRAAYVEDAARVYHMARAVGKPLVLSEAQVQALRG